MIPGEGKTTEELFSEARRLLNLLEKLTTGRRNRDKACTTLTDLYLIIEGLARRVQQVEFSGAPVTNDEDEDDAETDRLAMQDLLEVAEDPVEREAAAEEGMTVRELRLHYFRAFLDFQVAGCRSFEEIMLKGIALVRRLRPEMLARFGQSMAEVGRKTGRSRANIHALENRMVEELLKQRGARGFHGLGGQRSEEHRRKCREAQQGNTNRRDGERRKRAAA